MTIPNFARLSNHLQTNKQPSPRNLQGAAYARMQLSNVACLVSNQGNPYCRIWHLPPPLFQLGKKTAINKDQGVAESSSGGHRVRCFLSKRRNKKIEEFTMRHSGSRHFDCGVWCVSPDLGVMQRATTDETPRFLKMLHH